MKKKQNYQWLLLSVCSALIFVIGGGENVAAQSHVPDALGLSVALDDSEWEQVSVPGFGNDNNFSVVAMAEYQGRLYAMTRNQVQGAEVWRTNGTGWEQVLFPGGETNGIYGNPRINNVWARMVVFQDKLYFGFSSGLQGNYLGSTGCEIWRYDGTTWEPVISDKRAVEETGTITAIADCAAADANTFAIFTNTGKTWAINQWLGGIVTIASGTGEYRKFKIIYNTANQLYVQQNETAGTLTDGVNESEYTVCEEKVYNNPFPKYGYTLGAVNVGDSYEINLGWEQNGFGNPWNKTITAMVVHEGTLYVSTGLNYEYGGQVWYTSDGDTWEATRSSITATEPYTFHSFGNFHDGQTGYPGTLKPISSSVTDLVVSSISGTPVLYAGGTGTSGPAGGCARMAQLTAGGWQMVVDSAIDANDNGTNENGFGSPSGCGTNEFNFMPWSLTAFMDELLAGVSSGAGARVLRAPALIATTPDPNPTMRDDARWMYSVGEGNVAAGYTDPLGTSAYPNGFDGYIYPEVPGWGDLYQNLAVNLFPSGNTLFGGTISQYIPEYGIPGSQSDLLGAQVWRSPNGMTWTQVTDNGFGDADTIMFEAFVEFDGTVYVSGSKGSSATPSGLGGAKIYRLAYEPCVTIEQDQTLRDKFERFTVTGITTEVPGPDPNPPGLLGVSYLRVGDLDGNGKKEIVATSGTGASLNAWIQDGAVAVFKRTSDDLSTWTQSVIRDDFAFPNDPVIRDVDGDDVPDIMVLDNFIAGAFTKNPAGIYLLKNLGGDITDPNNWEKITIYSLDPNEVGIDAYEVAKRRACYHQAYFVDLDGDGNEDFVTTRVSMEVWQAPDTNPALYGQQYMWTEWFRAETDLVTYPAGFSGPYDIGDGIGFLMDMHDVDEDGLLDVIGPQFFITVSGTLVPKGFPDGTEPYGDSLVWFKNPGQAVLAADPNYAWERFTIDNWYSSANPVGKAFMMSPADVNNDGIDELIITTHNHQEHKANQRIWPAGVYYVSIPVDPYTTANWTPVTIDAGDAYTVDRSGGPYSQGSPGFAAVGDITSDGRNDLAVAGDGRGAIYYYESLQPDAGCSLKFGRAALWDDPASMPAEVKLYDLDGDGGLEILGTAYDTSLAKDSSSGSIFIWKLIPEAECLDDTDCLAGEVCVDGVCESPGIPPSFIWTTQVGQGSPAEWTFVEGVVTVTDSTQALLWTTADPDSPDYGLGWPSRRGVVHSYVSYRAAGQQDWSAETETVWFSGLAGFASMWSWVYLYEYMVVDNGVANGLYEIKLISEDADGLRSEEVHTIEIAVP